MQCEGCARLAGVVQQLSQRLFAALALRKSAAIVAAAAGSPLQATAVHATAFQVVNDRISDLLRPGKASHLGQQGPRSLASSSCRQLLLLKSLPYF